MQHLSVRHLSALVLAVLVAVGSAATSTTTGTKKSGLVDCSQYQLTQSVGKFQVRLTSILDTTGGTNGYLHAEVAYPAEGWVALGWSSSGMMTPGYAVIGLSGLGNTNSNPATYNLGGYDVSSVTPLSSQSLNASVAYNSTHTVLTLVKRLSESGELAINGAGSNHFLIAYGPQTTAFAQHTDYTSFAVGLQNCVNGALSSGNSGSILISGGSSDEKQLWTAHGVFAAVAWGVLAPVAISASVLRRIFIQSALPALWFKIHMIVNVTVFIFTAVSFAFAVRAIDLQQKQHFTGVQHRKTGLIIMILLCVQVLLGILRPHLPHQHSSEPEDDLEDGEEAAAEGPAKERPTPPKSIQRIFWEIFHRLLGFLLVGFSWWQVGNGLGLYSQYFSEKDLANVFWGITAALSGVTLFLYLLVHLNYV